MTVILHARLTEEYDDGAAPQKFQCFATHAVHCYQLCMKGSFAYLVRLMQ